MTVSGQDLVAARPLLEVRDLSMHFAQRRGLIRRPGVLRAVDGVDLDVPRASTFAIVGESGSGKSTLARTIMRLYQPTSGTISLDGEDLSLSRGSELRRSRRKAQMIFQDPYASLDPRMTVAQILSEPLEIHRLYRGSVARKARVVELMELVGLNPSHRDRYPHQFSGGQRQRISIARTLAVEPELIIADEPLSALDVSVQAQIVALFKRLHTELGLSLILITHDLAVVPHLADRLAVMYLGRVVETGPTETVFANPLHPYTVALLSAVSVPDPEVEAERARIIIKGDPPSPLNIPKGCRFQSRCWMREALGNPERCTAESPPLREFGDGHAVECHFAEETVTMSAKASRSRSRVA